MCTIMIAVLSALQGSTNRCPPGLPLSPSMLWRGSTPLDPKRCARAAPLPSSLASCSNLVPAGTGTASTLAGLRMLVPKLNKSGHPWHHDHTLRIGNFPASACFVISLRDPADRMRSGFFYDSAGPGEMTSLFYPTGPNGTRYFIKSISHYLAALADLNHPEHASAFRNYLSSVAFPEYRNRAVRGVVGGNHFLVSQLDYLRDLRCGTNSVSFVCTERLDEDLRRLAVRFGLEGFLPVNDMHLNRRINSTHTHTRSNELSHTERSFINRCLYPWDATLHDNVCGTP